MLQEGAERLIAAVAHARLASPPDDCALDGFYKRRPRHVEKTSHVRESRSTRAYPSGNVTPPEPQCPRPRMY